MRIRSQLLPEKKINANNYVLNHHTGHKSYFLKDKFPASTFNRLKLDHLFSKHSRVAEPCAYIPKQQFSTRISSIPPTDDDIETMVRALNSTEKKCLEKMVSGAMSFGSISFEAHTTIAEAVNRIAMAIHGVDIKNPRLLAPGAGPKSNSGEGGELPIRDGTIWQSRIRQIASGRFGVNLRYLVNADMLQIKINQGAKPGKGGELRKHKVTPIIAQARQTQPGKDLISPPPHHDIYSIEDLKQLIHDLKSVNPDAIISVKIAAGYNVGVIAVGIAKAGADDISIAGPGGTGASPLSAKFEFIHPWESALSEVHQTLTKEGLRKSVTLTVSGGLQTGLDFFKAAILGAQNFELGSSMLVALGCTMAEVCHKGNCPTGIATTDEALISKKFKGKPINVARLMVHNAKSFAYHLQKYGCSDPEHAVGRTDFLEVKEYSPLKNLENLLVVPSNPYTAFGNIPKSKGSSYLETSIITDIKKGKRQFQVPITSRELSFGARIGYFAVKDGDFAKILQQNIEIKFNGIAPGQSFGFAAPSGLTLIAENSNDGTGKALDGATIVIRNISGNQVGYGGTKGTIFSRFMGDRALVRNSGINAVVEQIGQMGANFMTGGRFTILGQAEHYNLKINTNPLPALFRNDIVGPNLGAGMTGGQLVLPKKLYQELRKKGYLTKTFEDQGPSALIAEEADSVWQDLCNYNNVMHVGWVKHLLNSGKQHVLSHLIKLDPTQDNETKKSTAPIMVDDASKRQRHSILNSLEPKPNSKASKAQTSQKTLTHRERDSCGTGVLVRRNGKPTKKIVEDCLNLLANLQHRGATGIDPKTGDGCGIAWYGLHHFFQNAFPNLPLHPQEFAVIHIGLPHDNTEVTEAINLLTSELAKEELKISGQRSVAVNSLYLGHIGRATEPQFVQYIVIKSPDDSVSNFEKKLVKVRLRFELQMQRTAFSLRPHILSASAYYVIYKALVREEDLGKYFKDFIEPTFTSSAAVPHSRFSTNTLPNFKNIQPLARVANNGENNSIELLMRYLSSDPSFAALLDVNCIDLTGYSDSNVMSIYLDMLYLMGYSIEQIALATIQGIHPAKKMDHAKFYNLFALPFDGPNASIILIEDMIVVVRDQNGFRPQRGIINNDFIYSGSELALDLEGNVFDLPPAQPLKIHLATGECKLYDPSDKDAKFYQSVLGSLRTLKPTTQVTESPFTDQELSVRKLRGGWNDEITKKIMQPLFENSSTIESMADQGPIESLVRGSYFDLSNFIKGKFSQVTNPPLAKEQEYHYMSTERFIGIRPSLANLSTNHYEGYKLDLPVLDNAEYESLLCDSIFKSQIIDTNYSLGLYEEGIKAAITAIAQRCVELTLAGTNLLVLSDVNCSDTRAPIPPLLVASAVEHALLKAGLRHKVNIIMQTSCAFSGAHIAQLFSIGGVDAINPYLVFTHAKSDNISVDEFTRRCNNYKKGIRAELLGFMASMGISSLSAYVGCKGFNAYGLDAEVADVLGIDCHFGGVGFQDISRIILTNYRLPLKNGLGKYDWQGQEPRTKIWNAKFTKATIDFARGNYQGDFADAELQANLLKRGWPRGWLRLRPPSSWNHANPLRVCILGGGAAGFYQAQELLATQIPLNIVIIEKNVGNKFGLLGDGIAPDHVATKRQSKIFVDVINNPRVRYYGGIELGKDVSFEELSASFPCVIDCRGAAADKKLNIPGEDSIGIVPASKVYKIYNSEFTPFHKNYWPFMMRSKNPILGIIGGGNVAADLARIFIKDSKDLEKTQINPIFLEYLQFEGPSAIRIFIRGNPSDCKIGFKELQELEKVANLSATFDDSLIDKTQFDEHQQKKYDFFSKIKEKPYSSELGKIVYFHFQIHPKNFKQIGSEVEGVFATASGGEEIFRMSNYIVAIGRSASNDLPKSVYSSGWVTGEGGSLRQAEDSARRTTQQITSDFYNGKFPFFNAQNSFPWMLKSPVGNEEFKSILGWLEKNNRMLTENDFKQARRFNLTPITKEVEPAPTPKEVKSNQAAATILPNCVTVIAPDKSERHLPSNTTITLLELLKKADAAITPAHECDGELTCGTCSVEVVKASKPLAKTGKEAALLKMNNAGPETDILACAHKASDLKQAVIRIK